MTTRSFLAIALVGALLAAMPVFAQPKRADADASQQVVQKAVLETNAKMVQAANSLNAEAFFEYIVDNDKCVIIQNGAVFKTRREALLEVKRGFQGLAAMDRRFENSQVTVISPETALLTSEGTYSATLTDGRVMAGRFAVSLVFVRSNGQWKMLHGHYSMPPRPQ